MRLSPDQGKLCIRISVKKSLCTYTTINDRDKIWHKLNETAIWLWSISITQNWTLWTYEVVIYFESVISTRLKISWTSNNHASHQCTVHACTVLVMSSFVASVLAYFNKTCTHSDTSDTKEISQTRKLSYSKDDCAMRPIYRCPENFWESLSTLTATFAKVLNGLLFWSILWMCAQNLKFVALLIPEITGGTQKIWAVPGYVHDPFSPKFLMDFCTDGHCKCTCQIWSS